MFLSLNLEGMLPPINQNIFYNSLSLNCLENVQFFQKGGEKKILDVVCVFNWMIFWLNWTQITVTSLQFMANWLGVFSGENSRWRDEWKWNCFHAWTRTTWYAAIGTAIRSISRLVERYYRSRAWTRLASHCRQKGVFWILLVTHGWTLHQFQHWHRHFSHL